MSDKFILVNGKPTPATLEEWAAWFESSSNERVVCQEMVGDAKVSTVFLGLDHSHGDGPPVLWETMVFGGAFNDEMARCSGNREQAEAMHQRMVERVKAGGCR